MSALPNAPTICQIHMEVRQQHEEGLLGLKQKVTVYRRYVADMITPSGIQVIAETPEFADVQGDVASTGDASGAIALNDELEAARQQMVQSLMAQGWQINNTDQYGNVISMKR